MAFGEYVGTQHAIVAAVTERTRAIIVVHAFGQPTDMAPILEITQPHDLVVIEDACEAMGAECKMRRAGTLADVAIFAFYPNRQMTTGEGGMIVTDDPEWSDLFRSLSNQGRDKFGTGWLQHPRLGYNYRLGEMSAALELTQLNRIEELLAKHARVAAWCRIQNGRRTCTWSCRFQRCDRRSGRARLPGAALVTSERVPIC